MRIQRVMLVLGLCGCGTSNGDRPIDDAGGTDARGDDGGGSDGGVIDAGGGGDDLGTEIAKSGTRIKMKVWNTPDGAKQFASFVDASRNNEECSFQRASDGMTRCLPTSSALAGIYYGDAACTVPVALTAVGCVLPIYVTVPPPSSTCFFSPTPGPAVHLRGAVSPTFYQKSGTTCIGPNTSPLYVFYGITGAEIPPSSFQIATSAIE